MAISPYDKNKSEFFKELEGLRPDLMYPEMWSDEEKTEVAELFRPTRIKMGMLSSIPMHCYAEKCAFAESCPLMKKGIAPRGKPCPIEMAAVQQFFADYVEELEVDVTRMVEVSMVRDLVDQEIQQMRKTWLLSQEHFIQENVAGVDSEGNVVTKKELHQAVDYEERILKRKEKLRNQLLATRESKAKAGQSKIDHAQAIADLMEKTRQIESDREREIKRKLGIVDQDDYIEAEIIAEDSDDGDS